MNFVFFDFDYILLLFDFDYEWGEFMVCIGVVDVDSFCKVNDEWFVYY